jgi:hypothetical protein
MLDLGHQGIIILSFLSLLLYILFFSQSVLSIITFDKIDRSYNKNKDVFKEVRDIQKAPQGLSYFTAFFSGSLIIYKIYQIIILLLNKK